LFTGSVADGMVTGSNVEVDVVAVGPGTGEAVEVADVEGRVDDG
jgi:hypothetical protein